MGIGKIFAWLDFFLKLREDGFNVSIIRSVPIPQQESIRVKKTPQVLDLRGFSTDREGFEPSVRF